MGRHVAGRRAGSGEPRACDGLLHVMDLRAAAALQGEINSTYLSLMREATDVMGAEYGIWSLVGVCRAGR